MRRKSYFYQPNKTTTSNLSTGDSFTFLEPNNVLSEQMTPRRSLQAELSTRQTAWNYYQTLGFLPNPSETLRRLGKDISEFKYLLEDSHVNGVFSSRKAGTLGLKWTLDQNRAPSVKYNVIKNVFDSLNINEIMAEMLNCVWFGYQPVEIIWETTGGYILPKAVVPKDPDWFRFSDNNELRYLTKANQTEGIPVPKYKFLCPRHFPSYERPYGRPLAASCYWACKFKHTGYRFLTLFIEKYGMPWVKLNYPLGTQQSRISEMIEVVNATTQDGIIAWPSEFGAEVIDVNKTSSSDIFRAYIDMANDEISIAILGQTLTTKMDAAGGSFAAAKVHGGVREDLVDCDVRIIEDTFDTLIEWIYELNFSGPKPLPLFKLVRDVYPTESDAKMALSLSQVGVKFNPIYFQNRFNMNEDEFTMGPKVEPSPGFNKTIPSEEEVVEVEDQKSMEIMDAAHDSKDMA